MTAANSTPLSDGASAVLLASEEWAKERDLPVLAYFVDGQTAAVDHVHKREGLLMAPAYAMPRMLDRVGLRPAATSTSTRSTRPSPPRCSARCRPGRTRRSAATASAATSRSARSTASSSTSTAARSPPAIPLPRPAGASSPASPRRCTSRARAAALISICAAGGQGVVAVLESTGESTMSDLYYAGSQLAARAGSSPAASACPSRPAGSPRARRAGRLRRRPQRRAPRAVASASRLERLLGEIGAAASGELRAPRSRR